ncbi:MAG: hypothetical protein ACLS8Q_10170 [Anaerovoracaceae bacterium]
MRIRTIKNAYREIREQDPNTCITEWFLRQLITGGAIPSIRAGTKWLVDLDVVEEYIQEEMR